MPRVHFSFSLTGGGDKYGTPFANADDAFGSTAQGNDVLVALLAASIDPVDVGIYLPPTDEAYRITAIAVEAEDNDDDIYFGMYDGTAAREPLATFVNGTDTLSGLSFIVPSGWIPFLSQQAASGTGRVAGYFDWEHV